jgi:OmpA-OmpF porin, OOP family
MTFRRVALTATVLAAPTLVLATEAAAQPVTGIYAAGGAGLNWQQSQKVLSGPTFTADSVGSGNKLTYESGVAGSGSVGYGLGNGLRLEVEGIYLPSDVHNASDPYYGTTRANGTNGKYGAFVNALYDIDVGTPYLYPYLGAGAGYAWQSLSRLTYNVDPVTLKDTEGSFAFQGIAGVAVPILPVPGLSLTAEYHFLGTTEPNKFDSVAAIDNQSVDGESKLSPVYDNVGLIGLRYAFDSAGPPPSPPVVDVAPTAGSARSYLVFFGWDRTNLTAHARDIIAEAAAASSRTEFTRIAVNGYTDTSGASPYNLGLSARRAAVVRTQLVTDGVPANAITVLGFGQTHLLVVTGPGVRQARNRRVEVIVR